MRWSVLIGLGLTTVRSAANQLRPSLAVPRVSVFVGAIDDVPGSQRRSPALPFPIDDVRHIL